MFSGPSKSPPPSPVLKSIDGSLQSSFESAHPLSDNVNLIQCKHCRKPMLSMVAYAHIKVCLQRKNEKAQKKKEQKEANRKAREAREKAERAEEEAAAEAEGDEDSANGEKIGSTGKKSAFKTGTTSKKRKAEGEADKAPTKKKTKKEIEAAKPKIPKPKGPVDVEKQCGVLLPNGQMCARSLTCKSHAMGAKRAVPGRSLPYDLLLQQYQKKNQAKQQSVSAINTSALPRLTKDTEAAIDANAPLLDDPADPSGPIDSDEEKDLVMAAIARSRPKPLAQHVFVPMRKRYNFLRMKDLLGNALGGRSNVFGGGGVSTGMDGEGDGRRMSFAQPASARGPGPGGLPPPSRKSSVVTSS